MASEVLQVGAKMRLSVNGGAYGIELNQATLNAKTPTPLTIRVGRAAQLQQRVGYVLRSVAARVEIGGLPDSVTAAVAPSSMASPAVVVPERYTYSIAPVSPYGSAYSELRDRWTWSIADTTVPLGLLYSTAADVNSPEWGGIALSSVMLNPAGDTRMGPVSLRLLAADIQYRVSPKPQWQLLVPAALGTGQTGQVSLRVAYPDGEAVVGLRIRLRSTNNAVAFGADRAFTTIVETDNAGRISVPITAVRNGADAVRIELADPRCAPEFFSPPLAAVMPVNATVVRVDGQDCILLPAVAAVPAQPATYTEHPTFAWDAGANSTEQHGGDVVVEFSGVEAVVGAVVGLTDARDAVPAPDRIAHGWYLHASGAGLLLAQTYERGRAMSQAVTYGADTEFRIERRGARITYRIDGVVVRETTSTLHDEVSVGAALFGAEDSLFETET